MSKKIINQLEIEIKQAEIKVKEARELMLNNGINTKRINNYNKNLIALGDLQTKRKYINKSQKPTQYMEEIHINGYIFQ
jgi:hypothetical protein